MSPIIIEDFEDEEFYVNKPLGLAYGRIWESYIEDALELTGSYREELTPEENREKRKNLQEMLLSQGYESMNIITRKTLHMFFGGQVTSWDELLKILKAFQKAEFKYPLENAFFFQDARETYEPINEDMVVLWLKEVTPEIAKKYDKN